MTNINYDDGFESFMINNDPNRIIRINPQDFNILERFDNAMKNLEEKAGTLKGIKTKPDGTVDIEETTLSDAVQIISDFNTFVSEQLNYIFNSDVYKAAFGVQSPLSIVGPNKKYLFEVFLEATLAVVESKLAETQKELDKRVEKYTAKYHK